MARNPKKVVEAFTASGASIAGIELREFSISTMLVLEKLHSPLVDKVEGAKVKLTDLDVMSLVYVLSHPSAECFALLRDGTKTFDEAVVEFAEGIKPTALPALGDAINKLFARAMSTAPMTSGPSSGKKKT